MNHKIYKNKKKSLLSLTLPVFIVKLKLRNVTNKQMFFIFDIANSNIREHFLGYLIFGKLLGLNK